jgi:SAM-dependent methyltransferase
MTPPPLTDRAALLRHRIRAARAPALFLHELVRSEVEDRLNEVNRSFTSPAIVTGWPDLWRMPGAKVVPDDEVLDLAPAAHDLVIHALALHWANDPVGQLIQCARALRPDGLLIAALFGGRTLQELRVHLAGAEAAVTQGLSPRVLPMGDIRDLGALLQRAGLSLPVADSFTQTVAYRDAWHLMRDLRAMGEGNALAASLRRPTRRAVLAEAAARYAAGQERITATFEIVFLTGWTPHESQQKPLRPGSATHSLAEALQQAITTGRPGSADG